MDETKLDWNDLRLFLSIARSGGLAGAARETGRSAPTLGRRMLALEAATGQELFIRHARGYTLTAQGQELLERASAIESQIAPLHVDADQPHLVKVSAGTWMTQALCQHSGQIARDGVTLRFIAADEVLDIARRDAVIGLRNHRPDGAGLACQKVGQVRFAGYATAPDVTDWVHVRAQTPSARWLATQMQPHRRVEVTHPHSALDLARAGIARALLPTFIGDAQTGLMRVTDPVAQLDHDQWLVSHHEERFVPQIRATIDAVRKVVIYLHRKQISAVRT